MIRWLIIPLVLWLGHPVTVITDPQEETCIYDVRYLYGNLNTKVAKATFTLTQDEFEGQDAYKAEIGIKVQPIFRLFMHSKYKVEDYFTRPGMNPLYYCTSSNKGSAWCRYSEDEIVFWRQYGKMPEPAIFHHPNDGISMELVTLLYYVRTHDFKEGEPYEVRPLMGGQPREATLTMEGIETEKYPGHSAQILHLEMLERGILENGSGKDVWIWIDSDERRTPLGLQVALGKNGIMVCNLIE